MQLFPALEQRYSHEHQSAGEAQRLAQEIAFAPIVFQVSRLMVKFGILDLLNDHPDGLTQAEIAEKNENQQLRGTSPAGSFTFYRHCLDSRQPLFHQQGRLVCPQRQNGPRQHGFHAGNLLPRHV